MGKINSRQKGCRGERMVRDLFREAGFESRRGQQFSGGTESPDVINPDLPEYHIEVKFVENLNISKAIAQSVHDAGEKIPLVFSKKSHEEWLVTIRASDFMEMLKQLHKDERQTNISNSEHTSTQPHGGDPIRNDGASCVCGRAD